VECRRLGDRVGEVARMVVGERSVQVQLISSFCFFRMSNRYTFGAIFGVDMIDPSRRSHYRQLLGDTIVSYLTSSDATRE
jgi:tetracycline repressor-like protein